VSAGNGGVCISPIDRAVPAAVVRQVFVLRWYFACIAPAFAQRAAARKPSKRQRTRLLRLIRRD